jgi:LacI family fructose operon transcriptional repressor
MVNIKDVAREAGVSIASVSRVLHNQEHVSDKMRARVQAAVEKLDYRPNLVARNLRAKQSNTIGLILSDVRNPFFTDISRAVEDFAYDEGFTVFLCNTDESPEKEEIYLDLMHAERVAGVIYSPTRHAAERFDKLDTDFPVVVIDRLVQGADVDMVLIDNEYAGYRLATHLLDQGYRRLAGVFGEASTTGRQRHAGIERALSERGLTLVDLRYVAPKIEAGKAATLSMLENAERPDAIVATNSLTTAGAYRGVREHGLAVPDDIAIAGFDEATWTTLVDPPVTVIAQPTYEIGRTATELLLQRMAAPERATRTVILEGKLLARASTAARTR